MAGTGDGGGGGVLHRTTVRARGHHHHQLLYPNLYVHLLYSQMLHACTVSDPQNGAFSKTSGKNICLKICA